MTGQVEIVIEADSGVRLTSGGSWQGLRVRYRQVDAHRWERFLVIGAPGQSLGDLLSGALTVIAHSDGGKLLPNGPIPDVASGTEQLDFGVSA